MQDILPLPVRRALGGAWHATVQAGRKKYLLWSLRGRVVRCNVCDWEGRRLTDDQWHAGTVCPNCGSQVRHRLLAAILEGKSSRREFRAEALLAGRDVLHFAPERQLRERIRKISARYVTADYDRGDTDRRLDISAMAEVADDSFAVVIACDVLEHVSDDAAAFREILRILSANGTAILTVPQKDPPASTDSDPATDPQERLRRFGQRDHVRMYGDDFADRAAEAGFQVTVVSAGDFPAEDVSRHVLGPPSRNPDPLATNQRRIYFCRKAC